MVTDAGFVAPITVDEAVAALGVPDAVALAGGTSIGLLVSQGLLDPACLVWLGRIAELRRMRREGDRLVIGAGVTLRELAADPTVRVHLPALAEAAAVVGNSRVRAAATIGGALAHADPRQDLPPACLAHRASVQIAGPSGRRSLPVEDLATGFMSTVLEPDEVLTAVTVPLVDGLRSAYLRYTPGSADDYPTVGVAAAARVANGVVTDASVAVAGAGPRAYLVPEADGLVGRRAEEAPTRALGDAAAARARPVDDRLGTAAYKQAMVSVWARRAVDRCLTGSAAESSP